MQELEVTWARVGSVAWLLFWRSVVGGAVCGFVGGLLVGIVDAGLQRGPNIIAAGAMGWLFGLAWTFVVLRMALVKRYQTFRIVLIPVDVKP